MKIGIITFHWATNYGAILQTYALQTYLENAGHDVSIINYRPKQYSKSLLTCFKTPKFWRYKANIVEYLKEIELERFRKEFLNETRLYDSLEELKASPPKLDVYICGSDQVWNPSFTTNGEGKYTSSYFLDFGDKDVKRLAYAVSFGCEKYPTSAEVFAKKYVSNFTAISVRENSGLSIVSEMGFKNPVKLPDPTLLLLSNQYAFSGKESTETRKKAFIYILRKESAEIKLIKGYFNRNFEIDTSNHKFKSDSIKEWTNGIKNASIVLTNSFHGVVFSLIFHVPFVIVAAKGKAAGMNDRFNTLLTFLNLDNRIVLDFDKNALDCLIKEKIDWMVVDRKIAELRASTDNFFKEHLDI